MTDTIQGMATPAQLRTIKELTDSPDFAQPLASFLKTITGGRASSLDELTNTQAQDVLKVFTSKR